MSEQTPEPQTSEQQQESAGKRAARLRAAEAEARADALAVRLNAALEREVRRAAAPLLTNGSDVLDRALGGVELAELLDDSGEVDLHAVERVARAVTAARPGLAAQRRTTAADYDGGPRSTPGSPSSWSDVIRGGRR